MTSRPVRNVAVFVAVVALTALVVSLRPSTLRAETEAPFPRPAKIEPNVQFWVDVFTQYTIRDFLIHDRDHISRVYQVFHMPGDGQPTREEIDWANAYLKAKYGDILNRLAAGHEPETYEERHVAEFFKGEGPGAYALAAQNLRVQEGLRERFRDGLVRSRYYRPTMERIFRQAGLPPELVTLAQVESGFETRARSGAGATGIWQFTRSTGRKYMHVTRYRDDRLNPVRSTEAAAKLLRYNYDVLGDWPLAITAYNYGTGGTARAAEQCGSDYCKMVSTYNGPHFGFAVRNYYSEFLAALQVHRYENQYFPGIENEQVHIATTHNYTVRRGDTPSRIGSMFGVTPSALMAANGISKARDLRVGTQIVIPSGGDTSVSSAPARVRTRTHKRRHVRHLRRASAQQTHRATVG